MNRFTDEQYLDDERAERIAAAAQGEPDYDRTGEPADDGDYGTDIFDPRELESYYDVHFWPHAGRVLIAHKSVFGDGPVITDLLVNGGGADPDGVMIIAHALAEAGRPHGDLYEHGPDGSVTLVALHSLARTPVRPAVTA